VSGSVDEIFQASPDLLKARQAAEEIVVNSPAMMEATNKLADKINTLESERSVTVFTALLCVAVILFSGAVIAIQTFRNTQQRLAETDEMNERNQNAILRLLDELADLADGDLTTTATVTEDFTGAIADSINFTIDQLRVLVSQINDTAVKVSSAAEETQSTALHLAEASDHQAQEIAGASAAVNEMAVTIDQVSSNAGESSAVAERSVTIANKGAEVVQNTIRGMDNIREQIQETSKRIKRLGESSQEIGDIVSLINDIADQTNILSLNAAIQASMAGDAGRGFAVVADEVQRLAERSSAATKQIEALVKTIQSDTNEAVISMEQTTAEVVRGANLAQDAGTALEEIETVSQELAELIQNISNAARQQASSAGHISNTMNVIQEITTQTSSGTTATAQSIGNLAGMANELRESVAGFKLPDEEISGFAPSLSNSYDDEPEEILAAVE
jgi:twitching motility protein PilJ